MVHGEVKEFDYPSTAHAVCPWSILSHIRAEGSVHRIGDSNRYLVSHYDDVEFVLRSDELFSGNSEERLQPFDVPGPEGVPAESLGARTGLVRNVIELDPPHHRRRRDRMFRFLKPARLESYRPMIEEITDRLIDDFIDSGQVELMHGFAYQLPTHLIIRILGLGPEDFDWMHAWGLIEWRGGREFMTAEERARQPDPTDVGLRVTAEILKRVEEPRDDGLTEMIRAQIDDDGKFNLAIVRADLGQFVLAGITTTGHLIGSAMLRLVQDGAARELVMRDHSKVRPMLEEVLRLESPLQWIPRVARADVCVGGVPVPAGSYLIVMLQSANRDEAKWGPSAGEFDVGRRDAIDHLALGKGPHFCVGAPLGRLEAQIAVTRLLARLKNVRLASGEPTYQQSTTVRGLTGLNLVFDPV